MDSGGCKIPLRKVDRGHGPADHEPGKEKVAAQGIPADQEQRYLDSFQRGWTSGILTDQKMEPANDGKTVCRYVQHDRFIHQEHNRITVSSTTKGVQRSKIL